MNTHKKVLVILVVMLLLLTAVVPAAAQDEEPLTEEEQANVALVEKFFAIYNDYDMEAMGELLTDDVVWAWSNPWDPPRTRQGKEAALKLYAEDKSNNMFVRLANATAEGDTVRTIELWDADDLRRRGSPLTELATFRIRDGKVADWEAQMPAATRSLFEKEEGRGGIILDFAAPLVMNNVAGALRAVADDAVFVFSVDPLTGKRIEVKGKENITPYLEELVKHKFAYDPSTVYHLPRHLEVYGFMSWDELRELGIRALPTKDKIQVEDGKIVRLELAPISTVADVYKSMTAQEANKEIVRSAVEAFISADAEAIATYYAEDAMRREMSVVDEGLEAIQNRADLLQESFDDFACTLETPAASGDRVFVQSTCTGTVSDAVEEPYVTGKTVTFAAVGAYTLKDGKIVEESLVYDTADVWRQLGFELAPAK